MVRNMYIVRGNVYLMNLKFKYLISMLIKYLKLWAIKIQFNG